MSLKYCIPLLTILILASCRNSAKNQSQLNRTVRADIPIQSDFRNDTLYRSNELVVVKVSPNVYQHISFLNTIDFGRVPSNGAVVLNKHQTIIFDTPVDDASSEELIKFVNEILNAEILAVIPTHFHQDCIGGLGAFDAHKIPIYASFKTIARLKNKHNDFADRMKGFEERMVFKLGDSQVLAEYVGEGHTTDNIIGYFPMDKVMFGGCLVKEMGATKGNLEDANTQVWPQTILKLKQKFPYTKIVIPGHGNVGGKELLDYTGNLFK